MKTFIGIDLHTNRFTCCYRDEAAPESKRDVKRTETFELTAEGLAAFYQTLTTGEPRADRGDDTGLLLCPAVPGEGG